MQCFPSSTKKQQRGRYAMFSRVHAEAIELHNMQCFLVSIKKQKRGSYAIFSSVHKQAIDGTPCNEVFFLVSLCQLAYWGHWRHYFTSQFPSWERDPHWQQRENQVISRIFISGYINSIGNTLRANFLHRKLIRINNRERKQGTCPRLLLWGVEKGSRRTPLFRSTYEAGWYS